MENPVNPAAEIDAARKRVVDLENSGASCATIQDRGRGRPEGFAVSIAESTGQSKATTNRAIARADALGDERGIATVDTPSGYQQMLTINESGEWGVRNFAGTLRPLCSANKVPGLVY